MAEEPVEIKLTNPEGASFDQKHLDGITSYAKENKLTQEQAQGILVHQHQAVSAHIEANKPQIPDAYNLKAPDGSLLNEDAVVKIATYSKERGFTQEQAEAQLQRESEVYTSFLEGQKEVLTKTVDGWLTESKADPEFGGEGFAKNAELAKRFIEHFGSQKLKTGLSETGFGDHPELIRMVLKAAKEIGMEDDKWVPGTKHVQEPVKKSTAEVFYGEPAAK